MAEQKSTKRKISIGGGFRKLLIIVGIIWVVVNPLGAATAVHDTAYWIHSLF